MSENEITLTINGREVTSAAGRLLIDVAEEHEIFVPRFCYHPGLESVAACRMCLVEIEGSKRPLEPACVTPVADGMVVTTDSEAAAGAQQSVLELLLINHPLDCPICDRGGECPLQDQALRFGPGSSRYAEEKRHFPKPIPISKLVMLDRERCVLCWRCVRFSEEVAGDPFIDLLDRGSHTQVNTAEGHPFESYFSGNTIQICPVGALTAAPYRFLSRPWDLEVTQSVCSFCSVGCPITVEQRGGEVLRAQALPNESVNSFWNCDKGRFGHHYVSSPERLRAPLVRRSTGEGSTYEESTWQEALDTIANRLRSTIRDHGPQSVAMIGGSHAANEELFAASRFFKQVVGTTNLDFRTFDAAFDYRVLGSSTATFDDLDKAKAILWWGPDPKEELPVLYLRLRRAVARGAKLIVIHPRKISLSNLGTQVQTVEAAQQELPEGPIVICAGQRFIGEPAPAALVDLARSLPDARLLTCVPNANSQGAIDMGLLPRPPGLSTSEILTAAADGRIKFLWIMGADIVSDFPDQTLADAALAGNTFIVAAELFPTDTARSADVILPATSFAEKEGTFTNLERRIQKLTPAVNPPGTSRADWQIFADLAHRLGHDWNWHSAADVAKAIAQEVPTHKDYSWADITPPSLPKPRQGTRPAQNAWPLSWELRAVDATRRKGWIWPSNSSPDTDEGANRAPFGARPPSSESGQDPPEGFSLVLLVGRALFDNGQMVSRSQELRAVTPEPFAELHPDEARRRNLSDGSDVTVASVRGSVRVKLRISEDTPRGAAFMLFDQPGVRVNRLMDASNPDDFVEVSA